MIRRPNRKSRTKRRQPATRAFRLPPTYRILVECDSEAEQEALWRQLKAAGRKCRVLTL